MSATATPDRTSIPRPAATEHHEYYGKYIAKVPEGDLLSILTDQARETVALVRGLSDEQANHAYAPGKWSIKEVIGHISDAERVFAYRALTVARNDKTPLPSFDENAWAADSNAGSRPLSDLLDEFQAVRAATIQLARGLEPDALARIGTASGNPVSPRALLYIAAGHERHHVDLLRERYLSR
jgi:uncharacterized damage-inducible protein DinB